MIWRLLLLIGESRVRRFALLVCVAGLIAAGCAHQPSPQAPAPGPPGFVMGLFHGFIIGFSFVGSLFSDVRIYAFPNSGGWYDFGFMLGISAVFSGGHRATHPYRSRRRRRREDANL